MITLVAWAVLRNHDHDTLTWWGAAALTVVIWEPEVAWGASFQLSFSAVLGLLVSAPTVRHLIVKLGWDDPSTFRLRRWAFATLCSCFSAWVATVPISIYHFGFISLGAPIINAAVVPYVTLVWMPCAVTGLGLVSLGAPLCEWAGIFIIELGNLGLFGLLDLLAFLAATIVIGRPSGLWVFFATVATMPLLASTCCHRSILQSAGFLLVTAVVGAGIQLHQPDRLRVTFLNVGHGDSAIVQCPGARPLVIDGGGAHHDPAGMGRYTVVPSLHALGISSLASVVNTHADLDHIGGLVSVLKRRSVDHLWWNGLLTASGQQLVLLSTAILQGIDPFPAVPSSKFQLGDCIIDAIAPPSGTLSTDWTENNRSLVLRIRYGQHRFLFTGDIEQPAETQMLQTGANLQADIVKVPHHGSKTSSSPAFIRATRATVAVVSCDHNAAHGLPDEEVLTRWKLHGAHVLRTDLDGAITFESDGVSLWRSHHE